MSSHFICCKMSSLALLVLLSSSLQYSYANQECTKADLCEPVNADICDNDQCLVVNASDIHNIINTGGTVHDFNILPEPFTNGCKYEVRYRPEPGSTVPNAVNGTLGAYLGESCTNLVSGSIIFSSDIDPSRGQLRLLTAEVDGETFEDCFIYIEPRVGFVYRRCVIDSSPGACAAIYSVVVRSGENTDIDKAIKEFLSKLKVAISKTVVQCVA